jgi:hypothetical protein
VAVADVAGEAVALSTKTISLQCISKIGNIKTFVCNRNLGTTYLVLSDI